MIYLYILPWVDKISPSVYPYPRGPQNNVSNWEKDGLAMDGIVVILP